MAARAGPGHGSQRVALAGFGRVGGALGGRGGRAAPAHQRSRARITLLARNANKAEIKNSSGYRYLPNEVESCAVKVKLTIGLGIGGGLLVSARSNPSPVFSRFRRGCYTGGVKQFGHRAGRGGISPGPGAKRSADQGGLSQSPPFVVFIKGFLIFLARPLARPLGRDGRKRCRAATRRWPFPAALATPEGRLARVKDGYVRALLDAANLQTQRNGEPSRETLAAFARGATQPRQIGSNEKTARLRRLLSE